MKLSQSARTCYQVSARLEEQLNRVESILTKEEGKERPTISSYQQDLLRCIAGSLTALVTELCDVADSF